MISFPIPIRSEYPAAGCIRFLKLSAFVSTNSYNWFNTLLEVPDRTLSQWIRLIQEYETPLFSESPFQWSIEKPIYQFPNVPDPFFHRPIVAETLRSLLDENMRLRWILRKWLRRWRNRKCAQRIIGTTDVVTLSEIPDHWKISVCDPVSRSTYLFHAISLQKLFVSSLLNQSYAIAAPVIPKNPYTNVPWSLGQMIHIVGEIQIKLFANRHVFMDPWLVYFRASCYTPTNFQTRNNRSLQSHAAKTFFTEPSNLFFTDLYRETLQDLFQTLGYPLSASYTMILDRCLKPELMSEWDTIVAHSFVHTNHHFFPSNSRIRNYSQFEEYIGSIYIKTIQYVNHMKAPLHLRSGQRVFLSTV